MVEFCVQRQEGILLPISASDRAELMLLPEKRFITITANPQASLRLRRWFHAMLQLLVEATGLWPNVEMAKRQLLVKCGFFDSLVISNDGSTRFTPQSTTEWGNAEWRAFLDVAVPYVIEHYVGESRANFRDRVDAFVGIRYKEAINDQ